MLLRYKLDAVPRNWGLAAGFFTILVTFHFIFLAISPYGVDELQLSGAEANLSTTKTDYSIYNPLKNVLGSKEPAKAYAPPSTNYSAMYPPPSDEEYVAICLAVRGQHADLPEFMTHHYHHLGIRRFYIMDDGSEPPLSTYDDYGIPRKHITFHYYNRTTDHVPDMQDHIYNSCMNLWRNEHTWMAFLDADEMLEMTGEEDLTTLLKRLEKNRMIGALAVQWQTHTSNGLLKRPISARKGFTDCIWDGTPTHNQMYKSIVKTEFHNGHNHVHQAFLTDNTLTVGEDGLNVPLAARNPITRNRIALHHYALKSREEYEEKIARSNAMDQPKDWSFWESVEGMGGVPCFEMSTYDP
ncbi:hypothetical protein G7Y89_g998 [Cudoniella acicularis]|uniref:Glycosyltransferase family 92 protein n=1 Tax=Cudoniella acicularis TaxID=354080 RepID=A0A8H4WAP8_9HELO|nr:hypothetical protein G7Y89_g998 [Cudoniella acicularis]